MENMKEMEGIVSVSVTERVGTIEDNLAEVEASIRERTAQYASVAITEDTVASGKRLLAELRKDQRALDDDRKEFKRRWMAPYNEFEERLKKVVGLYDEPIKAIDGQLKGFEEDRRARKREEIQKAYNEEIGDMAEWVPLKRIWSGKWENASCTMASIREGIRMAADQMRLSIDTIRGMGSKFQEDALKVLKETGDLSAAIREDARLREAEERYLERERKRAAEAFNDARREQENAANAKESIANARGTQGDAELPFGAQSQEPAPGEWGDPTELPFGAAEEPATEPKDIRQAWQEWQQAQREYEITVWTDAARIRALRDYLNRSGIRHTMRIIENGAKQEVV